MLESFVFANTASGAAPSNGLRHIAREYTAAVQPDACASQASRPCLTPHDVLRQHFTVILQKHLRSCQAADHVPDVVKALLLPSVQLTSADGSKFFMTPVDISQLPTPGFANLYTVSIVLEALITKLAGMHLPCMAVSALPAGVRSLTGACCMRVLHHGSFINFRSLLMYMAALVVNHALYGQVGQSLRICTRLSL